MGLTTVGAPSQPSPPPITVNEIRIEPKSDMQKLAWDCRADILFLGGSAGSLKTFSILVDACQEHQKKNLKAVIFRKSYPELEEIIEQSRTVYPYIGGVYNEAQHTWRFPAGGFIKFRFIENDKKMYREQGKQYTFIAFDESTHHLMKVIRYLLTRLRSTDPTMRCRMRLGSNPGNVSHKEHKDMFLLSYCFHCNQEASAVPGKLYWNTTWWDGVPLSDAESGIKFSTAFIPGKITDHNLLGAKYVQLLRTQNPAVAKALLSGCWEVFEGQFFDIWDHKRMVMPWQQIGYEWWWPHWVAADYGYTISSAAGALFCRRPPYSEDLGNGVKREWPRGRVYKLSEILEPKLNAPAFAQKIIEKWILDRDGHRLERRIQAMYLSPDAGKDTGVLGQENIHTLKGQMNKVLEPYGLAFVNASTDRVGGAGHMYNLLSTGEYVICQNCKHALAMIPTRLHDPDKENDVLKVKGDPLDDVYDCDRYGLYSPEFEEHKPVEEKLLELESQGLDPLSLAIRRKQVQVQEKEDDGPIVYGGRALRDRMSRREQRSSGGVWKTPAD